MSRGFKCGWRSSRIGGRRGSVVLPGCSNIHVHFLTRHRHTKRENLVAKRLPYQTNGNLRFPQGSIADLKWVGLLRNPKLAHGRPPKSKPYSTSRKTSSVAFMNPTSLVKSPKTGSFSMSNPCLRSNPNESFVLDKIESN